MKIGVAFSICVVVFLVFDSQQAFSANLHGKHATDLRFLKRYNGKYAYGEKLFDNAVLKARLQKLLGKKYRYFTKKIWQVETPIRTEKNFFYAWAMQAHSGGDPSATLLADMKRNILYVEISNGNEITTYAEDGSKIVPEALEQWARDQAAK